MTTIRTRLTSLLAAALCVSLLAVPAGAYTRVDTSQTGTLTLNYYDTERGYAFDGMNVSLYKIYDVDDAVNFSPADDAGDPFAAYFGDSAENPSGATITVPVVEESEVEIDRTEDMTDEEYQAAWDAEWSRLWQAEWTALTTTLTNYLSTDTAITPTATGTVGVVNEGQADETGRVVFENLELGVYLVVGETMTDGSYTYTPASFLVSIPDLDETSDSWLYSVTVNNKYDRTYHGGGGGSTTVNRNVTKVWNDADAGDVERPSSVTVELWRDGEFYSEVTLSASNGWQYSWTQLPSGSDWTLVETDVDSNYSVQISESGNTFVVTNTADTELEDEDPPLSDLPDEEVPGGEDPGLPDDGDETVIDDEDVPQGNLPQTGTLWLPVQILTIVGILLFSIGWLDMRRQKRDRHET